MHILLAEPSRFGRTILSTMLKDEGYEISCCDRAEDALSLLSKCDNFDVLLTSVEFSTMSGFELCWHARNQIDPIKPFYIIVLSSHREEEKLVEALDSGADDFIYKPVKKSELLARLRVATRILLAQKELVQLASFDVLTGLRNRRSFFEKLNDCVKKETNVSFLMFDIDYFKRINDEFGHDIGDDVLRGVAQRLTTIDRNFARLGGEEFALFVKAPLDAALSLAETVRQAVAREPIETRNGSVAVTISVGVSGFRPSFGVDEMFKSADIALYASKRNGRNRVTLAPEELLVA